MQRHVWDAESYGKYANCCEHGVLRDRLPYKAAQARYAKAWHSQKAWRTGNGSLNDLIRLEDQHEGSVLKTLAVMETPW
jgi:hypothetical protein